MYEFTHGGLWMDWSKLDYRSKWLAGLSLACAGAGAVPIGMGAGDIGYDVGLRLGYRLAGGTGPTPAGSHGPLMLLTPTLAWLTVALLVASGLLWWRFSLRQDEMFNRVQNWSLGMGSASTGAVLTGWAILAMAGAVPPVWPLALVILFWLAVTGFWMIAVRRWA